MTDTTTEDVAVDRRTKWVAVSVFNLIALVAFIMQVNAELGSVSSGGKTVKWVTSAISIVFAVACLAVLANMLARTKFVGTAKEGGLALLGLAFWAACVPAIMNPSNIMAVASDGSILNANLYFFSWFGLIGSFFIFANYLETVYNVGGGKNTSFNPMTWGGLAFASFVVFVSAARICAADSCDGGTTRDKRTNFAIAVGVISACTSLLWMFIGGWVHAVVDGLVGLTLLLLWVFGIIFITFGGSDAPAIQLGNLYFSTWASFVIALYVTAVSVGHMVDDCRGSSDTEEAPTTEGEAEKKEEGEGVEEGAEEEGTKEEPAQDV